MGQKLYNPNDGITGRDGGPYLDQEELKAAEIRRAEVEDREPDFSNMASVAGVQLVPAEKLTDVRISSARDKNPVADLLKAVEDDPKLGPPVYAEIEDVVEEDVVEEDVVTVEPEKKAKK